MKESGELSGNDNEVFRNIVHPICKAFPGEQLTSDIHAIRDSVVKYHEPTARFLPMTN